MSSSQTATLGIQLRSTGFYVLSVLCFLPFLLCFPVLWMPRRFLVGLGCRYLRLQMWLLRVVCGVRHEILGRENLPAAPFLIASQHESSWETLFFQELLPDPVMFAKKEVFGYPIVGMVAQGVGHIPVDRGGSVDGMREALDKGVAVVRGGRNLLIFPAGTRRRHDKGRIQSGIGVLYAKAQVPVVPILLNSGVCWPSGTLLKYPGTITVRVLPPIPPGLDRQSFLTRLSEDMAPDHP
ncbi:lysophospholipid acyltransferase family protein [Pelagimonas sp. KU-00592-HH]|uniref:lysophospholipid acyltransferase family protein n=1 Tax=Pelagimonas sp. KU-00592-HH TaxID=3127651 RepID=UPI003342C363